MASYDKMPRFKITIKSVERGLAFAVSENGRGQTYIVEHLGWRPLNAIGSTMRSVAERYKKQSPARKQGSVEYMIDFIKLSSQESF